MTVDEVKTDDVAKSTTPEIAESTVTAMASRLRFFLSNANLRSDKFLRRALAQSQDGFISIETFLIFNTVKKISTNPEAVVRAVQEDEKLKTILKLNEDKTSIARINPYDLNDTDGNIPVTLRVSGIPMEEKDGKSDYSVQREDIEEAFKEFGHVSMVKMLYNYGQGKSRERTPIGRAFVEMETEEEMKAAAEAFRPAEDDKETNKDNEKGDKETDTKIEKKEEKPNRTLKLGGTEVRVKTMQQWLDQRKVKQANKFGDRPRNGNARGRQGQHDTRGGERRDAKGNEKRARESEVKEAAPTTEFKLDWKKGCVISLKGLPEGCDREQILAAVKETVGQDARVRADYSRGQKDGAIRFEQPNEKIAELATKLTDGSITVGSCKVESASILEGEDEDKYYKDYITFRTKQMQENKERKRTRRR